MCGIAGLLAANPLPSISGQVIENMLNAIRHRGPDDSGVWFSEYSSLILGHRRLSIHDLSPLGHQPMQSQSNRYTVVFNGEIYNFKDVAEQLRKKGVVFKGTSDTEVLLAAIEMWGLNAALSQCVGMFALALADEQEKKLFLVRDRIGEKPLYYGFVNGEFLFASELKAITVTTKMPKSEINLNALASYLRYGYISAPQTIFNTIRKVEPGQVIEIDISAPVKDFSAIKNYKFWSLAEQIQIAKSNIIASETDYLPSLEKLLHTIIEEQAMSDVPLGAFLSGGIDSSLVASLLQSQKSSPIDTFSIGFNEADFDEAKHAKAVAQHIGSSHHEMYLSSMDALDVIPLLPIIFDEPFADSSQIPMYLVSKIAREKVTVCLSGDGGDELFSGYNRYIQGEKFFHRNKKTPAIVRAGLASALTLLSPGSWDKCYSAAMAVQGKKGGSNFGVKLYKLAELLNINDSKAAYDFLCGYWHAPDKLLKHYNSELNLAAVLDFDSDFIDAAMAWDQQWYLSGDNLVKTDRASMASSLELRAPLLDARLIQFSWQVTNQEKVKNDFSKWPLRQVLYKYVPRELIDRPKMGFSVPIGHWLRNELNTWANELLDEAFLREQEIFNVEYLLDIYREHLTGRFDHSNKLWTVLMFQAWYKHYIWK